MEDKMQAAFIIGIGFGVLFSYLAQN